MKSMSKADECRCLCDLRMSLSNKAVQSIGAFCGDVVEETSKQGALSNMLRCSRVQQNSEQDELSKVLWSSRVQVVGDVVDRYEVKGKRVAL